MEVKKSSTVNKYTEEQLDRLHEETMKNLFEIFEEEFSIYFKFYDAALEVLGLGTGVFPFDSWYGTASEDIEKSLDIIEKNISEHIKDQMKILFEESKVNKKFVECDDSKDLKIELSKKIKLSWTDILNKNRIN